MVTASSERSISQEINNWVQIIAIIIGSIWGGYTFIYKEILLPKSAPVNITLDLQLKKINPANSQQLPSIAEKLTAIEMKVSAMNPSSRNIYLLPSIWTANGIKVHILEEERYFDELPTLLNSQQKEKYIEKYVNSNGTFETVAAGLVFSDTYIKPNEKLTRKIIFYIPLGKYDLIDLHVEIISMGQEDGAVLEWAYDEHGTLNRKLYRIADNGERIEMKIDQNNSYTDTKVELQTSSSRTMLSLW